MTTVAITCRSCNAEFGVPPYRAATAKFCSRNCKAASTSPETRAKIRATMIERGIQPAVLPSREQCIANLGGRATKGAASPRRGKPGKPSWNKGMQGYLAGANNARWKGGIPGCVDCGEKLSSRSAVRCVKCAGAYNSGENHYAWNGGPSSEIQAIRTSQAYKDWRKAVYRRDWFACQMPACANPKKNIEAHHIHRVADHPELILEVNNGLTLCEECHLAIRGREHEFIELFNELLANK